MKSKFLKAILAVGLCLTMVLPFAACGKDDNGGTGGEIPQTTGELKFDESGNVVFNKVSFKLYTVVNGDDKDPFKAIVDQFNLEYRGKINVTVTNISADSYENTVASQINYNNNAPDLLMSHMKSHRNFAELKLIRPFDDIIEKSGISVNLNNFAEGLAKYVKHGTDNLYSVPIDGQSQVVFYNKKELAKIGKSLPTTRQELLEVCAAYKKATGNTAIAWSTTSDYFANYVYITAAMQNGLKLYDENTFKVDWYTNEANRKALSDASESIRELINLGYAGLKADSSKNLSNFMSGNSLFYFTDPWSMLSLTQNYAKQNNITEAVMMDEYLGGTCLSGWFAMTDNAQKNLIFGDSHFFAMSKTCTDLNKQAAILEFMNWYTSNAQAGADWAKAGHVSVSKSITASSEYTSSAYVTNYISKFYPEIDNFVSVGSTPHYSAIINNLKGLFSDTVNEDTIGDKDNSTDDANAIKSRQNGANNAMTSIY